MEVIVWSENGKNLSLFGTGTLNWATWCRFIMFSTRDKLALALFLITVIIATSTVISLATAVVYGLVFPFICSSSLVFNTGCIKDSRSVTQEQEVWKWFPLDVSEMVV